MKIALAASLAFALAASSGVPAVAQTAKKEPTANQLAARERQTKCAAEWKKAKAEKTLAEGAKWPKFWSECNKRLKAGTNA